MHIIQRTIGDITGGDAGLSQARSVPTATTTQTVADALAIFEAQQCEAVLVMDADRPDRIAGIFTERDLLNRVAAPGKVPSQTALSTVMTADPRVLRASDSVTYAINRMAVMGFSNIPVIDSHGRPTALLGVRDVVTHLHELFDDLEDDSTDTTTWQHDDWVDMGGG